MSKSAARVSILGVGLVFALATAPQAAAGSPDCEPAITRLETFTAGRGALRNTSTDGAETGGSATSLAITAVVQLLCPPSLSRKVTAEVATANNIGGAPALVVESARSKVLSGGETARFKFVVAYSKASCRDGRGPVPRDQGGVNQVNENAFTFTVNAWSEADGGTPNPNAAIASVNGDLVCKPSRTTSSEG